MQDEAANEQEVIAVYVKLTVEGEDANAPRKASQKALMTSSSERLEHVR